MGGARQPDEFWHKGAKNEETIWLNHLIIFHDFPGQEVSLIP